MNNVADDRFDVRYYLLLFKRRWWLILLITVVTTMTGAVISASQPKRYQASARLFVGQQRIPRTDIQFAQDITQTSLALVKSYSEAIKTRPLAESVIKALNLLYSPEQLLKGIATAPVQDTQIIEVRYTDRDSSRAQQVVNALDRAFIAELEKIDPGTSRGSAVQVSVLEPATTPSGPISPRPTRDGLVSFLLGGLLAAGAVLIAERLDSTVKGRDDVEQNTGLPVLAIVPHVKTPRGTVVQAQGTPAGEAYRNLRTAVQHVTEDSRVRVLAVTSPEASDGKTSTAFNLALAFAEAGVEVCLVEADLRNPSLGKTLQQTSASGLSTFLSGSDSSEPIATRTSVPHLHVIPAGPPTDKAAELLGRPKMATLLKQLSSQARIVIIDTPPVLAVSDPVALSRLVDGFLVVVRSGKTRGDHLRETMRLLGGAGATVFGVVVNDLSRKQGLGYGYGYGYYGYGYGPRSPQREAPSRPGPQPMQPPAQVSEERYEAPELEMRPGRVIGRRVVAPFVPPTPVVAREEPEPGGNGTPAEQERRPRRKAAPRTPTDPKSAESPG